MITNQGVVFIILLMASDKDLNYKSLLSIFSVCDPRFIKKKFYRNIFLLKDAIRIAYTSTVEIIYMMVQSYYKKVKCGKL